MDSEDNSDQFEEVKRENQFKRNLSEKKSHERRRSPKMENRYRNSFFGSEIVEEKTTGGIPTELQELTKSELEIFNCKHCN